MTQPLTVLINAQVPPGGQYGGVEQFVMGLVYGLGRLTDGEEQYILITFPDSPDWLNPLMGPNQKSVAAPRPKAALPLKPGRLEWAKRLLGPLRRPAGRLWRATRQFLSGVPEVVPDDGVVAQSDGFYESLGGDLIHFPFQAFIRCGLPSIYTPWDLQHLRYPQFWSDQQIAFREELYSAGCHSAQAVVAATCAVKSDLEQFYGLDPQKIFVIRCAPPVALYEGMTDEAAQDVRARYRLPDLFGFFPAQTWVHKNHVRLLEALRLLGDRHGVRLNLVCTGAKNEYWPVISRHIDELGLQAQVTFLGFVSPLEVRALYRLAQFVVFPSLFEGAGLPVIEAFQEGVAVTCSDIPPLREYGGDAVLTFDPHSTDSIAASLLRISSDEALREQLRARGRERSRLFTWERTGRTYRALYRKVAGVPLTEEDLHLLARDRG
jgi:glycosyltransferase involved in cell wall biosynthesis